MRSRLLASSAFALLIACGASQDGPKEEPPKAKAAAKADAKPKTRLVVDETFVPAEGDSAVVVRTRIMACASGPTYVEYWRSRKVNDKVGTDKLVEKKLVVELTEGTGLLVLKNHKPKPVTRTFSSPVDYHNSLQRDILDGEKLKWPVEVRVLTGDQKGELFFVDQKDIGRFKRGLDPEFQRKIMSRAGQREATSLLNRAQNADRAGRYTEAMKLYRQLSESYPGTAQAAKAVDRVKAFEKSAKMAQPRIRSHTGGAKEPPHLHQDRRHLRQERLHPGPDPRRRGLPVPGDVQDL